MILLPNETDFLRERFFLLKTVTQNIFTSGTIIMKQNIAQKGRAIIISTAKNIVLGLLSKNMIANNDIKIPIQKAIKYDHMVPKTCSGFEVENEPIE